MNQNFLKIQNQIRENSQNLQDYVKDLYDWEDEIGDKTKQKVPQQSNQLPPIRNAQFKAELRQLKQSSIFNEKDVVVDSNGNGYQRDVTPMPQYYKNWDRYDVDSELKKIDDQKKVDDDVPKTKEDFLKRTKGAKPGTKIVIKGGRMKANTLQDLKSAGNSYFASLEYEQAISSYSEAIRQASKNVEENEQFLVTVFSNRAQCYLNLKKYKLAEQDASKALFFDNAHIKSLNRRGQACFYLSKLAESKDDFHAATQLEPDNLKLKEWLTKTEKKIAQAKQELLQNMTRKIPDTLVNGQVGTNIPVSQVNLPPSAKNDLINQKAQEISRQAHKKKGLEAFMSDSDEELADETMPEEGKDMNQKAEEWMEKELAKKLKKTEEVKREATRIVKNKIKIPESAMEFERDFKTIEDPTQAMEFLLKVEAIEKVFRKIEFTTVGRVLRAMAHNDGTRQQMDKIREIEKEVKILTQISKNQDYELMKDSLSKEEQQDLSKIVERISSVKKIKKLSQKLQP